MKHDDYIVKGTRRWYHYTCDQCGKDCGFKHRENSGLCRTCSKYKQRLDKYKDKFNNVDFNDYKGHSGKRYYKVTCPVCNKVKGYIHVRSRWNKPCRSCNGKINGPNNTKGKPSWNRGIKSPYEQLVKQSCSHQGIKVEDFKGFTTKRQIRRNFRYSCVRKECFEKANYTCDLYGLRGTTLNAHHLNSWHSNEDKRFSLDNLVCLSEQAHKLFHRFYGNKSNTKEQYHEFKSLMQTIIIPSTLTSYLI